MRINPVLLEKLASNDATLTELKLIGSYDYYLQHDELSLEEAQKLICCCKNNTHLTTLTINNCLITNNVFALITTLLGTSKTLTTVRFNGNDLDNLAIINLAGALAVNTSVRLLDLRNNPISDSKAASLINLLKTNRSLIELKIDSEFHYPSVGLGGDESVKTNHAMIKTIDTLLQYNRGQKQTSPTRHSFFPSANQTVATPTIVTKLNDLIAKLDTECNLISFDTNKYMQLLALHYLNYLYSHKQHLDEDDRQDVLQKFPGLLVDKEQEVYRLLDKLTGVGGDRTPVLS